MGTGLHIERKVGVTYKDDTMGEKIVLDGLRGTVLEIFRHELKSVKYRVADFGDNMWPIINWMYAHLDLCDCNSARISRDKLQELLDNANAVIADRSLAPILFPLNDTDIEFSDMDYECDDYWRCFPSVVEQVGRILTLEPAQEKLTVVVV